MFQLTRREFGKLTGAATAVGLAGSFPNIAFGANQQVVVIGGGYGGAVAAKYIKMANVAADVTLIEKNKEYVSCPLSNPVIAGMRELSVQTWNYEGLKKRGINVIYDEVTEIDPVGMKVTTKGGQSIKYDKLIVSPGVEMKTGGVEGYDDAAAEAMPHAWKAGPQTLKLRDMVKSMNDGDNFVLVAPPDPYRCPPGPYERASLVAWYLKKNKPKSKVIILDPKDKFSKEGLFKSGWKKLGYNIEYIPGGQGGKVVKVDAKAGSVSTEMEEYKGVISYIPPQVAGHIAHVAGLVDEKGWCPVDVKTFESTKHKNIYVIGDACIAAPMPKSGYAANSEAKIAAAAIIAGLQGKEVGDPSYVNTCYSLMSPDYGISVALVAVLKDGKVTKVNDGVSPAEASDAYRKQEALYAESWYQSIMADTFS
ncbi:MAG: FAD-dependent oxidoreductase [Magnetococcales bacterium]|nr:FAD-dependent oxidoreductase [Magnetococcales bacterium]